MASSTQASFSQALIVRVDPESRAFDGDLMRRAIKAGGLAGTSVDVALFPLDTLKTRLQSSQGFIKAGGFSGIYRGLGSVTVGSAPGGARIWTSCCGRPAKATPFPLSLFAPPAAAFFTCYEQLKSRLPRLIPSLQSAEAAPAVHMLAASGGEVVRTDFTRSLGHKL